MERRLPGLLVLGLVSAGADVDEAVQVLIDEGLDADTLSEVETFVRDLELPPSARDRALLLIERTRLLVERATAGARVSRQLKADAARAYTADVPSAVFGDLDFLRHELATPLAVVQMAMEIIGSRRDDPDVVGRMALVARRNLAVASHLLDGLSSLEGLRIGRKELTWEEVDLAELVRECVEDVGAALAEKHEIDVTIDQPVTAPADRDAVRQIVVNLLTNAGKFSPIGSRIEVLVTSTPEHAEVAVRDHGAGLSPQNAERIFEAGHRLDPDAPGMGLGLYIARQLTRAHGGDLHVQQPDAGGSRFVLRLPRAPVEWQQSLIRREEAGTARDSRQRKRAVIADARDAALDQREETADLRDAMLTDREGVAGERDAELDRREHP